MHFVLLVI